VCVWDLEFLGFGSGGKCEKVPRLRGDNAVKASLLHTKHPGQ
jgi:hypothetical protein